VSPEAESPASLYARGVRELEEENDEAAVASFSRAEEGFVVAGELEAAATSTINRASILEDLGRFREALDILEVSRRRDLPTLGPDLRAESDLLLGLIHERLGNSADAISYCRSAVQALSALGDREHAVLASINLAGAYESAGEGEAALKEYRKAATEAALLDMSVAAEEISARINVLRRSVS
jgi:tetratricopeptide (TPR) repeat protein